MLQVNSEEIVKFCFKRIEDKWGQKHVSENQTNQMLDTAENNELEYLNEKKLKPELASVGMRGSPPPRWPLLSLLQEKKPEVPNHEVDKQEINEQNLSLNFANFCEIDKTQMNKVFKGLDGMCNDQRLHCFIRSPANSNGNEWFFAYTDTNFSLGSPSHSGTTGHFIHSDNTKNSTEFFPRSEIILDHRICNQITAKSSRSQPEYSMGIELDGTRTIFRGVLIFL